MLYAEYPFLDRFAMAVHVGSRAVEYLFPHEFDLMQVRARLENLRAAMRGANSGP